MNNTLVAINRRDLRSGDRFKFEQDDATVHTVVSGDGKRYSTPGSKHRHRIPDGPAVFLVEIIDGE